MILFKRKKIHLQKDRIFQSSNFIYIYIIVTSNFNL